MDGFEVMPLHDAAGLGDVFVTVTGNTSVIRREHFARMKDGAIVANSGHFNVEIDLPALKHMSKQVRTIRDVISEYRLRNGRSVHVLAGGRLVNLSCAEGHPASVMDMSFANQALGAEFLVKSGSELEDKIYTLPDEIDQRIASLKLKALGVQIDRLTDRQVKYLASWESGT